MKYINKFSTNADYQAFTEGGGYVTPNVCYVDETDGIIMKPYDDGEDSDGNLITFTIDDIEYQAEEGMTWGEWVNSKYNIDGYLNYNRLITNSSVSRNVTIPSNASVFSTEVIIYATYESVRYFPTQGGGTN